MSDCVDILLFALFYCLLTPTRTRILFVCSCPARLPSGFMRGEPSWLITGMPKATASTSKTVASPKLGECSFYVPLHLTRILLTV